MKQLRHILSLGMLIALVASASAQSWLTNGLVAYYPFNGNASDASGNGNDGTNYSVTFGGDRFYQTHSSASFNGGAYIQTPVDSNFPQVTLSAWFSTTNLNQTQAIIDSDASELTNGHYGKSILLGIQTNEIDIEYNEGWYVSPWKLNDYGWHHVCAIYTSGMVRLYMDGVFIGSQSFIQGPLSGATFRLGMHPINAAWFKGAIDDVRIYNRALSSNEVAQLYNIESTPPTGFETNGLVAYYPFNGNGKDESASSNNLIMTNALFRTNRFGDLGKALLLNKTSDSYVSTYNVGIVGNQPNTIALWVCLNPDSQGAFLVSFGSQTQPPPGGARSILLYGDIVDVWGGRADINTPTIPGAFTNQWRHLAVVYSNSISSTQIYLDGVSVPNLSIGFYSLVNTANVIDGPLKVGATLWAGGLSMQGLIDDVRIYNRALSSNDVAALYQLETAAPVFVTQPATVTHQIGEAVILSVQSAGGQPTTYTWHFSGAVLNSSTNSSLTIASLQAVHLGAYTVVASNQWGMATSSVATVYCPASITAPPMSVVSPLGGQALFLVEAAGYDLPTYQWMFNGTNLPNATASSLAVTNVQLRNAGSYAVVVSNSLGRVTSSVAWLSVSPSLYTPFVGATPIWGRSASIGVSAVGSGQLNFQWYLNGVAIDGATAPSINFPSIQFTNAGMYSVVISSAYGIVTNAAAEVSVNPAEVDLAFYPGLTINGHTGNRYTIQSSSDLSNTNNWITQTNLMLEMDTQLWFDSSVKASDPNNTQYFYRVLPEN